MSGVWEIELSYVSVHNQHPSAIVSVHATGASQRTRPAGAGNLSMTTSVACIHDSDLVSNSNTSRLCRLIEGTRPYPRF